MIDSIGKATTSKKDTGSSNVSIRVKKPAGVKIKTEAGFKK
jgi:hypothetical protein